MLHLTTEPNESLKLETRFSQNGKMRLVNLCQNAPQLGIFTQSQVKLSKQQLRLIQFENSKLLWNFDFLIVYIQRVLPLVAFQIVF